MEKSKTTTSQTPAALGSSEATMRQDVTGFKCSCPHTMMRQCWTNKFGVGGKGQEWQLRAKEEQHQ